MDFSNDTTKKLAVAIYMAAPLYTYRPWDPAWQHRIGNIIPVNLASSYDSNHAQLNRWESALLCSLVYT